MPLPLAAIALGASVAGGLSKLSFRKNRPVKVRRSPLATNQEAFAKLMQARAAGAGTSYADLQMQKAYDRAMGMASASAAGARGDNVALAQRSAQQQAAAASQGIAAEGAIARIQEQQAQSQLAMNALNAAEQSQQNYYNAQAQAQQAANALQAQQRAGNRAAISDSFSSLGAGLGRKAEIDQMDRRMSEMEDKGYNPYTGDMLSYQDLAMQDYYKNRR